MSEIDLGEGPPFPHQPGDASAPAQNLVRAGGQIRAFGGALQTAHSPVPANVGGLLDAPAAGVIDSPLLDVQKTSRASTFAAGALGIYESARQTYNNEIDRLNAEWTESSGTPTPEDATDDEKAAAREALAAKRAELRGRQGSAEGHLDNAATEVAGLLGKGPESMSDPAVAGMIQTGLRHVPPPSENGRTAYPLRLMTLNVGGGKYNEWDNQKGFDPGDVPGLARRILDEEVDVANLQEMFDGDVSALEDELEKQSGDDWTLAFAPATLKPQGGGQHGLYRQFGNVIAVRTSWDSTPGATGLTLVDAERHKLAEGPMFDFGDPQDARSMVAVTVETPAGERVTISTAHTDYGGVPDEDQARQIEDLRRHTEEFADESGGDHTVITGDLNHTVDEKSEAGAALREYEEAYENAGEDAGPTSDYGDEDAGAKRIDYVWTSNGLEPSGADRVEGDQPEIPGPDENMSDHDGIVTDIDVPYSDDPDANDPPTPERLPSGPGGYLQGDDWWRQ